MIGEIRVVEDVAGSFAQFVEDELTAFLTRAEDDVFVLGCSGGASGSACFSELARRDLAWQRLALLFSDERCVDTTSPDSNVTALTKALGNRVGELAGFYTLSCEQGAELAEATLRTFGHFDLLQLGFGPDGHTASLFPNSEALSVTDRLYDENVDPSGRNPFPRLTLTYPGIALARTVVFTVMGEEKAEALSAAQRGVDLPAGRVTASRVLWLCDKPAASLLTPS